MSNEQENPNSNTFIFNVMDPDNLVLIDGDDDGDMTMINPYKLVLAQRHGKRLDLHFDSGLYKTLVFNHIEDEDEWLQIMHWLALKPLPPEIHDKIAQRLLLETKEGMG